MFSELQYFDPISAFTPDLMHDVFEGIAKREIGLLLRELIVTSKYFSLERINNIIGTFNYGYGGNSLMVSLLVVFIF